MDFDNKRLEQDLLYTAYALFGEYNKDLLIRNLGAYNVLNHSLLENYDRKILVQDALVTPDRVEDLFYKKDDEELRKFIAFLDENEELLRSLGKTFTDFSEKERIYPALFRDVFKYYQESEFKDIILSYYGSIGDIPYKIAKKYFDEKRIHINDNNVHFDCGGYCDWIECIKSGYIFAAYPKFSTLTAWSIAHELGHIIDAETFVMPQRKNMPKLNDALLEVPSTTFEIGFIDYLKKNHIDIAGAEILFNSRLSYLKDVFKYQEDAFKKENLIIEPDGTAYDDDEMTAAEDLILEAEAAGKTEDVNSLTVELYNMRDYVIYGLGYWFAFHLNQFREADPQLFYKLLSDISMGRVETPLEESIEKLGISVDEFVSGKYIMPKLKQERRALKRRYHI